jgi:hypothetical protein
VGAQYRFKHCKFELSSRRRTCCAHFGFAILEAMRVQLRLEDFFHANFWTSHHLRNPSRRDDARLTLVLIPGGLGLLGS